jgi:hypothetical protein
VTKSDWVKEEAEQLPPTPMPAKMKAAEFDEIFTYIGDKKPNLSHYTCRSRNTLFLGLESSLGTLTRTCASHRRPCSQG